MMHKDYLKDMLSKGKLKQVIDELLEATSKHNTIVSLSNRFRRNEKDNAVINRSEYEQELNRIDAALLNFIDNDYLEAAGFDLLQQQAEELQPLNLDLDALATAHCLRPMYSKLLIKQLFLENRNLNLIGDSGLGKSRQLADIKLIAKELGVETALVNLKDFRLQYDMLLKSLATQLHLVRTEFAHIGEIFDALVAQKSKRFLIMVDNLEVLNEYQSNDKRYNAAFVSSLNFLKNHENTLLFCASRTWLKEVCFQSETSLLELQKAELPKLKDIEIAAELQRRCPDLTDAHSYDIRRQVRDKAAVYQCLENLIPKLLAHYDSSTFTKKILNQWLTNK